jgi:hypothetical protein
LLVHLELHPKMLCPLSLYVHMHLNKRSSHFGSHSLISLWGLRLHQVSIDLILIDLLINLLSKDLLVNAKHLKSHQIYELLQSTQYMILIVHQPCNLVMMHLAVATTV